MEAIAHEVAAALETDSAYVYLYDERTDELVLRATHGTSVEDATKIAADAARRGDHGRRSGRARAGDDRRRRAPRPTLQGVPEPARGRLRVDPRRPDPRAREARRRAQRPHPRAARVHAGRGRPADDDRGPGGAVDRAREALRPGAAPRARARGARADLRGRLGVALPGGVARGDRADDGRVDARDRSGDRARGRADRLARGPRRRRTRCGCRCAGGAARSASSSSTATRRSPTTTASCSRRSRARPPWRSSTAAWRCAACSPRRSTTASRTTCRPSPRCCGSRRGAENVDPQKALGDSVNRILAIAAVHEVLTEHREDDVELDELIDRLRAMLVQGLVAGKEVQLRRSSRSRSQASGRRRSRSSSASCSETRSSTAGRTISITLSGHDGEVVLAIADDGDGMQAAARRHRPLDRPRARPRRARRRADARRRRRPARRGQVPGTHWKGRRCEF